MPSLGKYELHEELGKGGFATVYRATHKSLHTEVALKLLSPALAADESARQRFIQEAQTASSLEHPRIVQVLDLGEAKEQVFLTMEYLPGGDLRSLVQKKGVLPQPQVLQILKDIGEALDFAHSRNVLHRDVKTSNILLDGKMRARLSDFGLVRVKDAPHLTQLGTVVGTAAYTSPEQAESKPLDARSDQYSLGIVAYELLVGKLPFQGEGSTAVALMHITKPPPQPSLVNPEIPTEVDAVLLKALSKQPGERYASCTEFILAIESALESSQRRRYRELLAQAQTALEKGDYAQVGTLLDEARLRIPARADLQATLAELESARRAAEDYQQITRDWESARQQAQDVLELFPQYPDPQGIFATLGLRKARRSLPPPAELARQAGLGALLGLPLAALALYLAFRFITRR